MSRFGILGNVPKYRRLSYATGFNAGYGGALRRNYGNRATMRRIAQRRRFKGSRVGFPRGPPGTTRRALSRTVREMPLYAPTATARPEMKFVDTTEATYAANTTGTITHISQIAPGNTLSGREGNRCILTGVQLRGTVQSNTTTGIAQATCAVVWDRQPNNALTTIATIFDAVTSNAFQSVSTRDRFSILGRWNYVLIGNTTTPTVGREEQSVDVHLNFQKEIVFVHDSGNGAIGNVVTGALLFVTMGDIAAGTADADFTLRIRVYFGDA